MLKIIRSIFVSLTKLVLELLPKKICSENIAAIFHRYLCTSMNVQIALFVRNFMKLFAVLLTGIRMQKFKSNEPEKITRNLSFLRKYTPF